MNNLMLFNKNNYLNKIKLFNKKFYHSENGVYGYVPKSRNSQQFKVPEHVLKSRNSQANAFRWIENYRIHGHKIALTNSVSFKSVDKNLDQLKPDYFGLTPSEKLELEGLINVPENSSTVKELEKILNEIYCGQVSAEFSYIETAEEKEWLSNNYENLLLQKAYLTNEDKKDIAKLLIQCQVWDKFLATKFPTVKRYGAEGAESMQAFFRELFKLAVKDDIKNIVVGMPHRGRGNLLTTLLNTRPAKIFKKFQGGSEFPSDVNAMGDVVSHYHTSEDIAIDGKTVHISMLRNPSHLEAVNPVSMGKTRSKQLFLKDGSYGNDPEPKLVLNVQLHGDAAFPGQGVNQECLMMSKIPHFDIGGTIHMVVNNQIGFTTPGDRGRCTSHSTDLAKSIQAPVFHVNGDDPELLAKVTKLAFDYQQTFHKDVFIDLCCFRRWGHNELDEPTFTNPALYSIINNRKSVPDLYTEKLVEQNVLSSDEAEKISNDFGDYLNSELMETSKYEPAPCYFEKQWKNIGQASDLITTWDTGIDYSLLQYVGKASVQYPKNFNIHPHLLKTHVEARTRKLTQGAKIDWSTAEALAIGSLMYQGHYVRISGEDVGRGTFSQRHATLIDQETNEMYIPLNDLKSDYPCGKLEIANSILSEEAVLGFEYGMSIDNPENLIIWEAQFGDFFNGAQIIIDNFLVSAETKWMECNGLVMLLPHGYDGAGSEHSSCRMERFLQLTDSKETKPDGDSVNLHVINPTTPAQYFHALRRQIIRNFRKPLIVVAPKILLRLSDAASNYQDFESGTHFQNVIGDNHVKDLDQVKKIILCSGKHYYNLNTERIAKNITNVALVRLESLSPFPLHDIQQELEKYPKATTFIWSQEEPRNMGAWTFVRPRFENLVGRELKYYGRPEAPTTAVGDSKIHRIEAEDIVVTPFTL